MKILKNYSYILLLTLLGAYACSTPPTQTDIDVKAEPKTGYPWDIPQTKPDRPLSAAMERLYDNYLTPRPEDNELFSSFKYTKIKGLDYNDGDGTISRRDPSKVIKENGKYYVWYTRRKTSTPPRGGKLCNDTIPSTDWDLSEIWYATSEDGFNWEEQGVAVKRPEKPHAGYRSVSTPDILKWKGKYYLFYQGFYEASGSKGGKKGGDNCPVAASYADSPDGPWTHANKEIIPNGEAGTWDQFSIHDPYPLVRDGKIYVYFKAAYGDRPEYLLGNGLAIADNPLGPYKKHPLNPLFNSGHETCLFPFKEGVAALTIRNGNEANTIQYSPDGVNFNIASVTSLMPTAAGPYVADAFTDTKDGRGITWGLCHFTNYGRQKGKSYSILSRFDCDLSQDVNDKGMKNTQVFLKPEVYFSQGLNKKQRAEREKPLN